MDLEIAKCTKKLDVANLALSKVAKMESQADYESTVLENVRQANTEKVRMHTSSSSWCLSIEQRKTLEAEIATLQASKDMFAALK